MLFPLIAGYLLSSMEGDLKKRREFISFARPYYAKQQLKKAAAKGIITAILIIIVLIIMV